MNHEEMMQPTPIHDVNGNLVYVPWFVADSLDKEVVVLLNSEILIIVNPISDEIDLLTKNSEGYYNHFEHLTLQKGTNSAATLFTNSRNIVEVSSNLFDETQYPRKRVQSEIKYFLNENLE